MGTSRTWTGAVNNDAGNPGNWSPTGAPQPGDSLTVDSSAGSPQPSTLDIRDNVLQGDLLSVSGVGSQVTLNLSHHAQVQLDTAQPGLGERVVANVDGRATLDATVGAAAFPFGRPDQLSINLASHANLFGSFTVEALASLNVSGADGGRFHNTGSVDVGGGSASFGVDVVGSGEFSVGTTGFSSTVIPGHLEFAHFVSRGESVSLRGAQGTLPFPAVSTVTIDDPKAFHATLHLSDFSLADLVGLAQADSWCYAHDLLSIRNAGGQVIDRVHIVSEATSSSDVHGLSLTKSAAGDVLISPGSDFHGGLSPSS